MRWVRPVITGLLADYVHRPGDHTDVLAGHRLDDVVKYADPGTNRDITPCFLGVEDLVPVKLYIRVEAVGRGGRSRDPVKFLCQRNRRRSVNEQRRHGEPVVGVGLVNVCQQHLRIVWPYQTIIVRFAKSGRL
jgi:hypothetical protein